MPFSQGEPLQDSQALLVCFLLCSRSHLSSLGTAEEIFALTTDEVSMPLWEKGALGQVPLGLAALLMSKGFSGTVAFGPCRL